MRHFTCHCLVPPTWQELVVLSLHSVNSIDNQLMTIFLWFDRNTIATLTGNKTWRLASTWIWHAQCLEYFHRRVSNIRGMSLLIFSRTSISLHVHAETKKQSASTKSQGSLRMYWWNVVKPLAFKTLCRGKCNVFQLFWIDVCFAVFYSQQWAILHLIQQSYGMRLSMKETFRNTRSIFSPLLNFTDSHPSKPKE